MEKHECAQVETCCVVSVGVAPSRPVREAPYRDSLALYQPVYLGPRDDIDPGECLVSQLKFKAE